MITSAANEKLPPIQRDLKAPLQTQPAPPSYAETWVADASSRAAIPEPAPSQSAPTPGPSSAGASPSQATPTDAPPVHSPDVPPYASHSQAPFAHIAPAEPLPASSPHSYDPNNAGSKVKGSGTGSKFAKAIGQSAVAVITMPVIIAAAALYGTGKLLEGIGKGLSVGPEALLKAYKKTNGRPEAIVNPYVDGQGGVGDAGRREGRGSRRHKK
ncbi:hypothetical protein BD310DRAFT_919930 [Dichomitus squalens]|uniref:Uncharacterized protein n=1 Tax=Dichomitus squalens TaxID=114155 RepID=A0A4Q9Q3S5_9APHY|nr:hypothetical protein BD310DRAFT_919930 [Dichomitus squalens]